MVVVSVAPPPLPTPKPARPALTPSQNAISDGCSYPTGPLCFVPLPPSGIHPLPGHKALRCHARNLPRSNVSTHGLAGVETCTTLGRAQKRRNGRLCLACDAEMCGGRGACALSIGITKPLAGRSRVSMRLGMIDRLYYVGTNGGGDVVDASSCLGHALHRWDWTSRPKRRRTGRSQAVRNNFARLSLPPCFVQAKSCSSSNASGRPRLDHPKLLYL